MRELKLQIIYEGQRHHTQVSLAHRLLPVVQDVLQLQRSDRDPKA